MEHREAAQFTGSNMPQSNTPYASSQNTYSRQRKAFRTYESPFEATLEAEHTGPTGVTRLAFPLFLPRSYLFASGRLDSNHFPVFHLP